MGCCSSRAAQPGQPVKSEAMPDFDDSGEGSAEISMGSAEERAAALAEAESLAPALLRSAYGVPAAKGAVTEGAEEEVEVKGERGAAGAETEVVNPLVPARAPDNAEGSGAAAAALSAAALNRGEPPDFTGEWLCTSATGMDELLKAMGFSWAKCKLAAKMKYGVGKATLVIMQDGAKSMTVLAKGGPTRHTDVVLPGQNFEVDGKPATAVWANGELVVSMRSKGGNGGTETMTRAINAAGILEQRMQKGDVLAIRYHKKIK